VNLADVDYLINDIARNLLTLRLSFLVVIKLLLHSFLGHSFDLRLLISQLHLFTTEPTAVLLNSSYFAFSYFRLLLNWENRVGVAV